MRSRTERIYWPDRGELGIPKNNHWLQLGKIANQPVHSSNMLKFGVWTRDRYLHAGPKRRFFGAHVAYSLLDIGNSPSEAEIRVFEDSSFTLRISNETFRTSFPYPFGDVDAAGMRWLHRFYSAETALDVQDRAVSHGLSSQEWAELVFRSFPNANFEACDVLLFLIRLTLPTGEILCIHPKVLSFSRANTRFRVRTRSVFKQAPSCHALRTMNILNRAYFSEDQLKAGVDAAFESLKPGGIWIVGRTLEEDFSNHVSFLRRGQNGWQVLERLGRGSEMEELALRAPSRGHAGTTA